MNLPLEIKSVGKKYSKSKTAPMVISDVSFEVKQGEIFGLIGLNGVGKTTLIKAILDLHQATAGEISIFGVDSKDYKARKNLSYLPEKFYPSQLLKGKEFLELAVGAYGKTLDLEKARADAVKLQLDPKVLDNRVGKYSKGMGQKLGLLSVFLTDAPLLILDEPMSGLDPQARVFLKDYILEHRKAGKTIFFSSHILSDVDELCDRIGVIHGGGLKFIGTPKEMKSKFNNEVLERAFLSCIAA
jgi:ABC-2 type transport system ATP-binding protein